MAHDLSFEEHTARWVDDDGDDHEHTVTAAIVVPSNLTIKEQNARGEIVTLPRQVTLRDGSAHSVRVGDVIVETDRPNVYDVLSAQLWETTGYGGAEVVPPSGVPARTVGDLSATVEPVPASDIQEVLVLLRQLATNNNGGLQPTQESTPPPVPSLDKSDDDASSTPAGEHAAS